MGSFPRRSFLKKIGVGLVAFGPAVRALAANSGAESSAETDAQDPSNYFVAGAITGINGHNLSVRDDLGVVNHITVDSATNIWKGRDGASTAQLLPGDFFYARGVLRGSTLINSQVWVNIVNVAGSISPLSAGAISVETATNTYRVDVPADTEVFKGERPLALAGQLDLGETAQIIGLWDAKKQRIQATRVFLPDPSASAAVDDIGIMSVYHGVTSWFCCGPAYGPCGAAGGGACGSCRSDSNHCAWPTIGTGCRFVGCGRTLPNLSCGRSLVVTNPCRGISVTVVVKDCGPNMPLFCGNRSSTCNLYADRITDLTPRAFSALASLSAGLLSVSVTV